MATGPSSSMRSASLCRTLPAAWLTSQIFHIFSGFFEVFASVCQESAGYINHVSGNVGEIPSRNPITEPLLLSSLKAPVFSLPAPFSFFKRFFTGCGAFCCWFRAMAGALAGYTWLHPLYMPPPTERTATPAQGTRTPFPCRSLMASTDAAAATVEETPSPPYTGLREFTPAVISTHKHSSNTANTA